MLPTIITTSKTAAEMIRPYLPPGVTLERVAADVRLALAKDRATWKKEGPPPLERCSPMSVILAVATIQKWGLTIGETAHLVPFGATCTPVADYKGLAELVVGSGVARHVEAHCVYEKESFRIKRGTTTEIEHLPIGDPKARGAMVGAYALFHLRGGIVAVEYMSVSEIEDVRKQYSKQWKDGPLPAWYARKCPVRRGVKLLPKNPALLARLAALDAAEEATMIVPDVPLLDAGDGRTVPDDAGPSRGPKALTEGGYGEAPVAPGSVNDHAEAERGELTLDDHRPARRDALREGQ